MKKKEINFPTQEWLDKWVDKWLDDHPNDKVEDFKVLEEQAQDAWWDAEVDKGNPTPFDLTAEQEKASKSARMGAKATHEFVKRKEPVKRERKPNEEKREIIAEIAKNLANFTENVEILNVEREISFKIGENSYSVTLTCHRKPKA